MGGKGGGSDTQTVKQEPWGPSQPYLKQMMQAGSQLPQQQYYPYSQVSPLSQTTQNVAQQMGQTPMYQVPQASYDQFNQTLQGDYMYGGDAFNRAAESIVNRATPGVDSTFQSLGRFGSGLHAGELQKTAVDALAGQYGNERKMQQLSAQALPALTAQDQQMRAATLAQRAQGGGIYDQFNQRKVDDAVSRWNFGQRAPYDRLGFQAGLYGGGQQGESTQSPVPGGSPLAGAIGGGLVGSQIPGMAFGAINAGTAASSPLWALSGVNPLLGMAGGALLGGLLS